MTLCKELPPGEQSMTVYKPIQPLAYAAVEAAVKLAKGEKLDTTKTMKAVNAEVPFVFIEPKVIEKSNLMDIVKDGYETYDNIFANIPEDQRPKKE